MRRRNKLPLLTLIICLCLAGCSQEAYAATDTTTAQAETLSLQDQHLAAPYTQVPLYIDGLLMDKACLKDGELYFSPAVICSWLDIDWSWQGDENSFTLTLNGIDFFGDSSLNYLYGNGRYFYAPQGWFTANSRLYLPYDLLCRYLCLDATVAEDNSSLSISTQNAQVIPGGDDYYQLNFANEDVFWMSQIIHAESWQQPMAGQIGVGNVVLNRVASEKFPDTIFDVIFDMEGVVQFEPVSNGSVYSTPDEQSVIAAYLALEGYNTVGDSLYFVNPSYGSYWFDSSLKFNLAIGDHNFYTEKGE